MQRISGHVHADQRQEIEKLGSGSVANGLRLVVTAGLAALGSSDPAVLAPLDDLHRLADRLAGIVGRTTPSGSWWAPTDAAMPSPDLLDPAGDVVASPGRVVLAGELGAALVDLQHGRIEAQCGDAVASAAVDLQSLARVVAILPSALIGLAQTGPGHRVIDGDLGLSVERLESGHARLCLRGVGVAATVGVLWCFAAELMSLQARGFERSVAIRQQLEQQLQGVGRG